MFGHEREDEDGVKVIKVGGFCLINEGTGPELSEGYSRSGRIVLTKAERIPTQVHILNASSLINKITSVLEFASERKRS